MTKNKDHYWPSMRYYVIKLSNYREHPSEKIGAEIRKLYSWNNESDKLINN